MNKIYTISLLLVLSMTINAQKPVYNFSKFNQAYNEFSDGTLATNGVWDIFFSSVVSLGFNFNYAGYSTNMVGIAGTGSIDLAVSGDYYISAFSTILSDKGTSSSLSPIRYKTEGASGKRIFKLQYKNAGFYYLAPSSDYISFQIWLYEETGACEFRIGDWSLADYTTAYQTSSGVVCQLFGGETEETALYMRLAGDPNNPTVLTETLSNVPLAGLPSNGTVYRFAPGPTSVGDVETISFSLSPNPANAKLYIQNSHESAIESLSLVNILGEKILDVKNPDTAIDVSGIASGVYFANITSGNKTSIKRVIIER